MANPKPPILPTRPADPTGMDYLERKAIGDMRSRLTRIKKVYRDALDKIPVELSVNARYTYRLDPAVLSGILSGAAVDVDSILLEGGPDSIWFFDQYVSLASDRGTQQQWANLKNQSQVYAAAKQTLADALNDPRRLNRIALIKARVFEEMEDYSSTVKKTMGRVLTDAVARGRSPRDAAKDITRLTGTNEYKARRIARTEITTALRRARWDEHDDAVDNLGLNFKLMHYSALSPTTRRSHAERHAHLYTSDEVRDWYAEGANAINCKCSQISVLVNDAGAPVVPMVIERAKATERKMRARGEGPWAKEAA